VAAAPSILIKKSHLYKGGGRTWSNRYHFNGGTPADATHWHTLMDNVVAAEKLIYPGAVTIIDAVGYAAGSDVPVAEKAYTTAGTNTGAGGHVAVPLEVAALCRWSTAARSTKNHPIYCFSYWHACLINSSAASNELLDATQKSTMQTYAAAWISGFSDGSITAVRATPNGAAATGSVVEEYTTHRDFPYTSSL
jgi:hypothetical protein